MKDYLNNSERNEILHFAKCIEVANCITHNWKNNLSKEESKALKLSLTWGKKALESIRKRQNSNSLKTLDNSLSNCKITVEDTYRVKTYNKKMSSNINDNYEDNKDYFRLVELLLYFMCRNCNECGSECDIYKEFENHLLPCIDEVGMGARDNCKYAYTD